MHEILLVNNIDMTELEAVVLEKNKNKNGKVVVLIVPREARSTKR